MYNVPLYNTDRNIHTCTGINLPDTPVHIYSWNFRLKLYVHQEHIGTPIADSSPGKIYHYHSNSSGWPDSVIALNSW